MADTQSSPPDKPVNGKKQIILNAFVMNTPGHLSPGLWRHPANKTDQYKKLSFWVELAQLLDKANFHAIFIADTLGPYDVYKGPGNVVPALSSGAQFPVNDPLYLVPAMAAATKSLIFGVTASLTYEKPYALARRLSTVDHLSEGRVAWNIVTSYLDSAARNHGLNEQIPHDERYAIAHEYLEVLYKLWEGSFRDGAVIADREGGTYIEADGVRKINHEGKYFQVPGPHFCEPSPQRTPFLFQAGVSEAGNGFGGKHGEAIFVGGQTPEIVRQTVNNIRKVASDEGRDPNHIKVIVGFNVIIAATDEEASAKREDYLKYADEEGALALFGGWTGIDLSSYADDDDFRYSDSPRIQSIAMRSVGVGQIIPAILLAGGTAGFYIWLRSRLPHTTSQRPREQSLPQETPTQVPTLPVEQKRGVYLCPVPIPNGDESETDVDIIAIHGLDTKSPDTWTWKTNPKDPSDPGVNWLSDPHMLLSKVGSARIFTCDWPADMFEPSNMTQKTNEEFARRLLDGIKRRPLPTNDRSREDRPIIFIASCLGGIILMKALVMADNEYLCIRKATRGILFLATPFGGTSFQDVAKWAEPGLKALASLRGQEVSKLLDSVKKSVDLDELVSSFTHFCQEHLYRDPIDPQLMAFYELGKTNLYHKAIPYLPIGAKPLVDKSSATLQIIRHPLPLDRSHRLMNKFYGPEDHDYKSVTGKIEDFLQKIRKNEADDWIRDDHYTPERLKIERLSGDPLPMDQCYINLAIVEQVGNDTARSDEESDAQSPQPRSSPFSLLARQKVETPDKAIQVELATIFNEREERDGRKIQPRRILIRGRAGVGKTTLCKKIVYEFCQGTWSEWTEKFDRVLWVPLRNLKNEPKEGYNLEGLLIQEYFSQKPNGRNLAHELWDTLNATKYCKTLFVLDGLDEVSGGLDKSSKMFDLLEFLLMLPNVITTSRPQISFPHWLKGKFDVELETIGFYSDQVEAYVEKAFTNPNTGKVDSEKIDKVQSFLQGHPLIQDLVRIPIQLDALCYTWDDSVSGSVPDTMTGIYEAIEQRLWKKDAMRLEKKHNGELVVDNQLGDSDVEGLIQHEMHFLESLAFAGLHNDVIEFTPRHREAVFKLLKDRNILLVKTLANVSFLRTSDPSSEDRNRNYHFLHLTFQEYFAARYFVRQWNAREPLESLRLNLDRKSVEKTQTLPIEFLQKKKYSAQYDVFWRFVAGLLDAERHERLRFFRMIEEKPLDLLGPTHQRLVMHCLSEVSTDMPLRKSLEDTLAQWLLFECTFQQTAHLASEMEFPEQALRDALLKWPENAKITILQALKRRPTISPSVYELAPSWLRDDASWQFKKQVCILLQSSRTDLTNNVITAVVQQLDNGDKGVRRAALGVLQKQSSLSDEILTTVIQQLDDEDEGVRWAVLRVLQKQSLSDEILIVVVQQLGDEDFYPWSNSSIAKPGSSQRPP
ncbi:hypothetical protein G7Z17_g9344 [Cylindrodendrum hubeiense]|uniref:NACHT domain-containing protein n=1 Tax=Cylindrodendrum hubeiense TaxID=595255 RepID=A0A9P5H9E1_9HYPO|nr:hypothetical protein G7Z17_g9344 [Cylindrodendrum hubeiense]